MTAIRFSAALLAGLPLAAVGVLGAPSAALAASAAPVATARSASARVSGKIESNSGMPLANVFVRQPGGLTGTFTDASGKFSLSLDPEAPDFLLATAPDRLPIRIALSDLAQPVVMPPAPVVTPPSAPRPRVPLFAAPARALDSGFGLRGDWRNLYVGQGSNRVTGAVDNEVGLDLALRRGPWLIGFNGMRYRPAIRVPALTAGTATTFAPEALEGTFTFGHVFTLGGSREFEAGSYGLEGRGNGLWGMRLERRSGLEVEPYLVAYGRSASSFANGARYTGTTLDFDDARWAGGLGGRVAGWLLPCLVGDAGLEAYPIVHDTLAAAPTQLSGVWGGKVHLGLGWQFIPQVRLEVGYQHELWRGSSYAEDADVVMVGLGYYPGSAQP